MASIFSWIFTLHCFVFPNTGLRIGSRPESDSMGLSWDLSIVTLDNSCILKMLMYLSFPQDCESPKCRHSSLFNHKQLIGWQAKQRLSCWLDVYNTPFWNWVSLVAQTVKHLPAMWETRVWSLGQEDPLEKENATYSSTLAWRIPWLEESSMVPHGIPKSWTRLSDFTFTFILKLYYIMLND